MEKPFEGRSQRWRELMATGITKRHSKGCPAKTGGRCRCDAGYEASVYSKREGKKIRKTFARESEAKSRRAGALGAVARGGLRSSKPTTIRQAWDAWHEGAKSGVITNKSGDHYKPSTLRSYERAMRLRVLPKFGDVRQTDLERCDLQDFVDGLRSDGLDPSIIKLAVQALRPLLRRAVARGDLAYNPLRRARAASGPRAPGTVRLAR
jgi:Phage integrase, N-terminal SAM-like domain